jgi:hypothetical protein
LAPDIETIGKTGLISGRFCFAIGNNPFHPRLEIDTFPDGVKVLLIKKLSEQSTS